MRLRNKGTSSAMYLLMFMSRRVRIMRYTYGTRAKLRCSTAVGSSNSLTIFAAYSKPTDFGAHLPS